MNTNGPRMVVAQVGAISVRACRILLVGMRVGQWKWRRIHPNSTPVEKEV